MKDVPVGSYTISGLQAWDSSLKTNRNKPWVSPSASAMSELGALASILECTLCVLIASKPKLICFSPLWPGLGEVCLPNSTMPLSVGLRDAPVSKNSR